MPTVGDLKSRITNITDELNIITNGISTPAKDLSMQPEILEFKQEAGAYDAQFDEEQSKRTFGSKSRKQSLQEFVLLFFYVAIVLLTCALILYSFTNGNPLVSIQIFLSMVFITLVLSVIIIRYG